MAQEKPSPSPRISMRKYSRMLSRYLRPQGWLVAALAAAILSNIALQLISPQILRRFVDAATSAEVSGSLLALGLLFMVVSLLQQAINLTSVYLSETVGWNATNALRANLVEHCIDLDMSFHSSRTPGEMIERVDGDVNSMANFFSQFAVQIFGNLILLVGAPTPPSASSSPSPLRCCGGCRTWPPQPGPPSARPAPNCSASSKSA
jgi:ATP-binding cassette, subfamily B, bacterial